MKLADLAAYYEENEPRGEYVLLVEGQTAEQQEETRKQQFEGLTLEQHMALYADLPEKEAMKAVAKDLGISKRDVYAQLKKA